MFDRDIKIINFKQTFEVWNFSIILLYCGGKLKAKQNQKALLLLRCLTMIINLQTQ